MKEEYYSWGENFPEEADKTQINSFIQAVQNHHYAKLIELRVKGDDLLGVVIEVSPELPQKPVVDIRQTERLCIEFSNNLNKAPFIWALRKDFPSGLPHSNLTETGTPQSLCLFEQDYADLRSTLTARQLLDRIFQWLNRAAMDQAHLSEQALEPFLLSSGKIIFDPKIFGQEENDNIYEIICIVNDEKNFICRMGSAITEISRPKSGFLLINIKSEPWHARAINNTPKTLDDLYKLLHTVNVDLGKEIANHTINLFNCKDHAMLMEYKWILLLRIPKIRTHSGDIEYYQDIAFLIMEKIGIIGEKLGVIEKSDNHWGRVIGDTHNRDNLSDLIVAVLQPITTLTPYNANLFSGYTRKKNNTLSVIGAGALGSQIVMNLAKQGFANWRIVDNDILLPHNCSRHGLSANYIAWFKAIAVAREICSLFNDTNIAIPFVHNILDLSPEDKEYKNIFSNVDHIFDFSVSPAVSKHIAFTEINTPKTSIFMLNNGRYLVALSQGTDRLIRLDDLDAQFPLVALLEDWDKMFIDEKGKNIRYAGACRDVTTILPQDIVALHSAIAASFLKGAIEASQPSINVWYYDLEQTSVKYIRSAPSQVHVIKDFGWEVRITEAAISKINEYREAKLPNETGGVLIGSFDIIRKIIYVVHILPSPPDSIEWPTIYKRGYEGLSQQIDSLFERTGGNLGYVGEWHSHPKGVSAFPSLLDRKAHEYLVREMRETGHPSLMLIKSDVYLPVAILSE